jgi:site-specific recombinase XerD
MGDMRPLFGRVSRIAWRGIDGPANGRGGAMTPTGVLGSWLSGMKAATAKAYSDDLKEFARWTGESSAESAAAMLIEMPYRDANDVVTWWRHDMMNAGLSSSTINRRLSSLRSVATFARINGCGTLAIDVEGVRRVPVRQMSEMSCDDARKLIAYAADRNDPKGKRDAAMFAVAATCGIRRGELRNLDLSHVSRDCGRLRIVGNNPRDIPVEGDVVGLLRTWIQERGNDPGPLFCRVLKAGRPSLTNRLTGQGVGEIVEHTGRLVGINIRTNSLRLLNLNITNDSAGGDPAAVESVTGLGWGGQKRYRKNRKASPDAAAVIAANAKRLMGAG